MDIQHRFVPVEATNLWAFCSIQNPAIHILIKTMMWIFSCLFRKILGHKSPGSKESEITHYLLMWLLLRFQESFLLLASFCLSCGYSRKSSFIPWIVFFWNSYQVPVLLHFSFSTAIFTLSRRAELTSIDKKLQKTKSSMNCPKLLSQAGFTELQHSFMLSWTRIHRFKRCVQLLSHTAAHADCNRGILQLGWVCSGTWISVNGTQVTHLKSNINTTIKSELVCLLYKIAC